MALNHAWCNLLKHEVLQNNNAYISFSSDLKENIRLILQNYLRQKFFYSEDYVKTLNTLRRQNTELLDVKVSSIYIYIYIYSLNVY